MEVKEVTLWGLEKDKWVERCSFEYNHKFRWNRNEAAKQHEEQYGTVHAFFPKEINPNDFPVIFDMLAIINKKVKGFQDDFYYHDCISLFQYDQDVVWSVRETGTYIFEAKGEYESQHHKDTTLLLYGYIEGCAYNYYRIKDNKIKKIKFSEGLSILTTKQIAKEIAA